MSPPKRKFITKKIGAILLISVSVCMFVFGGCGLRDTEREIPERRRAPWPAYFPTHEFNDPPITLHDIAYDVSPKFGYIVYVQEDGEYVPYLVLTTDYNGDGNVLLLRKHLLNETMAFIGTDGNPPIPKDSYYKRSALDKFLNEDFLLRIDEDVRKIIVESTIIIRTESIVDYDIGRRWREEEKIKRKVFLLSSTELDVIPWISVSGGGGHEGSFLKYFHNVDNERRIAYRNGVRHSWWTRSPHVSLSVPNVVVAISADGSRAQLRDWERHGVRPAFCLPRETPIKEVEMDGRRVFVLDLG